MMWLVPPGVRVPDALYSAEQKAAIALAYEPRRVTRTMVAELAGRGELHGVDGRLLPAFDLNASSVAGIARRARRSGVSEDDGLDPATARKLYSRLAAQARRRAMSARTAEEIRAAARALEEVERLRGRVEKLPPASTSPGGLSSEILRAHRQGGPSPPPEPLPLPEPKAAPPPEPEPVDERRERLVTAVGVRLADEMLAAVRSAPSRTEVEAQQAARLEAQLPKPRSGTGIDSRGEPERPRGRIGSGLAASLGYVGIPPDW
jgi:hypothetical protein